MNRLHLSGHSLALALGLVLGIAALSAEPVSAAIVDVSGIEVPPVGDPVPVDGQDQSPQPDPDHGPDSYPAPAPQPQPQPQPNPQPPPKPAPQPQPAPQPDPSVLAQQAFERERAALIREFRFADALMEVSSTSIPEDDTTSPQEQTAFGSGAIPAGLGQPGGLSSDEWKAAGDAQRTIGQLRLKWPLTKEETTQLEQAETQRNALWSKAVRVPGLTAAERERLRIDLHVRALRGAPPPPVLASDTIDKWTRPNEPPAKEPTSSSPVPVPVNPVTSYVLKEFMVNRPTAGVEYVAQELADAISDESSFGNFLGLAKIAVAYKTEGQASARAATADFLVGLIPIPQASFAVDGGRIYAKVAFQALNKFMTDAMKGVGVDFDKEKFWSELKSESTQGIQAYMEWIGNGAD